MPKNFVGECYSASIFPGIEKFYASERGEWLSRFCVENFLSHCAKKFRRGESFSVSLIPGIEKLYASESYVTVFDFLSNLFCLAVPKNFVGESYSASIFSGIEKFYASERGEWLSRFSNEKTLCHGAEKFRRGESFSASLISGIEKLYASESYVTVLDFLSNFFCLAVPKYSLGVIL